MIKKNKIQIKLKDVCMMVKDKKECDEIIQSEKYPIVINITRKVNDSGKYYRCVEVSNRLYFHDKEKELQYQFVKITDDLIVNDKKECCYINKFFDKFHDAEKWVTEIVNMIIQKRSDIIINKKTDLQSESVLIQD